MLLESHSVWVNLMQLATLQQMLVLFCQYNGIKSQPNAYRMLQSVQCRAFQSITFTCIKMKSDKSDDSLCKGVNALMWS